eukprot:SAG31_NODE_2980_length_4829_cov_3.156237_4_plen_153_part_00
MSPSTRTLRTVSDVEIEKNMPHKMTLLMKIESSIRHYVILKTELSLLTGFLTSLFLAICSVKLWFVFGILAFVLNFIPNVGSVIAALLPLPILIVDACGDDEDSSGDCLGPWQLTLGFFLPGFAQFVIGNVCNSLCPDAQKYIAEYQCAGVN